MEQLRGFEVRYVANALKSHQLGPRNALLCGDNSRVKLLARCRVARLNGQGRVECDRRPSALQKSCGRVGVEDRGWTLRLGIVCPSQYVAAGAVLENTDVFQVSVGIARQLVHQCGAAAHRRQPDRNGVSPSLQGIWPRRTWCVCG